MNKFEQVSGDDHQMSVAEEGEAGRYPGPMSDGIGTQMSGGRLVDTQVPCLGEGDRNPGSMSSWGGYQCIMGNSHMGQPLPL